MKRLLFLAPLLLAACGGGGPITSDGPVTVNVTVEAGAITCDHCTVTLWPQGAASAPAPAASAPAASAPPPASTAPLGSAVTQAAAYANTEGNLAWTSGGMGYQVRVASAGDAAFVLLLSTSNPGAQSPTWQAETLLDDSLDFHWPAADDVAIRAYLAAYVVPPLNTWLSSNSDRFASGMVFGAVSSQPVPTSLSALARIAGLLPQWVRITNGQASLQ